MKRIIAIAFILYCCTACSYHNKNVETVTDSAKQTIEQFVEKQPECKSIGTVCNEQIDAVRKVCDYEIKDEKNNSWNTGFVTGIVLVMLVMFGLSTLSKRIIK